MDPYRTLPRYSYVCRRSVVLLASLTTTTTISMKKPIFLFPDFLRVISYIVYIEIFICIKANLSEQISCGFTRRTYSAGARQIPKIAPGNWLFWSLTILLIFSITHNFNWISLLICYIRITLFLPWSTRSPSAVLYSNPGFAISLGSTTVMNSWASAS